jgi:hypothetical protein
MFTHRPPQQRKASVPHCVPLLFCVNLQTPLVHEATKQGLLVVQVLVATHTPPPSQASPVEHAFADVHDVPCGAKA